MRIVFDILGSTERSGGMRLHSTELVSAWLRRFPEDSVTVLGGAWARSAESFRGARVIRWPNEGVLGRFLGQTLASAVLGLASRADYVVSLSPIVSPLVPRRRAVCFQHDWRHKKLPDEFPAHQRFYRNLWEISARHALLNVCISDKAAAETREHVPGAITAVIPNGRDHARGWRSVEFGSRGMHLVTFGHHNNKRPELVIEALALLRAGGSECRPLFVLGTDEAYSEALRHRAVELGIKDLVTFPGFVDNSEYERLVASAAAVLLVSSDEGFGLPVAEAEFLGIPAIIADDSGMADIFGDYPLVARPNPESVAEAITEALRRGVHSPAAERRSAMTWEQTAATLRSVLLQRLAGREPRLGEPL